MYRQIKDGTIALFKKRGYNGEANILADKNLTNIQIYQRKTKYNIGVILFGIIFIYLVITILAYVTNKKVSVYEVREGSILKDNAYTGLVLRDEQIVKADSVDM